MTTNPQISSHLLLQTETGNEDSTNYKTRLISICLSYQSQLYLSNPVRYSTNKLLCSTAIQRQFLWPRAKLDGWSLQGTGRIISNHRPHLLGPTYLLAAAHPNSSHPGTTRGQRNPQCQKWAKGNCLQDHWQGQLQEETGYGETDHNCHHHNHNHIDVHIHHQHKF